MKRNGIYLTLLIFICFAYGCASGSILITGKPREAISPDQVVLYTSPPPEYEVIGHITASSDSGWTQQGSLNYAVERLKVEASKVGANGVLVKGQGLRSGDSVGFFVPTYGGGGMFYAGSSEVMQVSGDAIWVPAESISDGGNK